MKTKLTITLDEKVIEKGKKYAKSKGKSLSELIESYLKMAISVQQNTIELTPIVKSLKGSFKASEGFDYKEESAKRLTEKYL